MDTNIPRIVTYCDSSTLEIITPFLSGAGLDVVTCNQPTVDGYADIALVDSITCQDISCLRILRETDPDLSILVFLRDDEYNEVPKLLHHGATECLPVSDSAGVVDAIHRTHDTRIKRLQSARIRHRLLAPHLRHPEHFDPIVTQCPSMVGVLYRIESAAQSNTPILITGETGSGKDLVAQAVHVSSGRTGPFIAETVSSIDDDLFADMLFGHVAGAFPGAVSDRPGLLATAKGGTLYLDEIGDLSERSQLKLLRVLERHQYFPIGSDEPELADVQFVLSTNCNLEAMVETRTFREDLYYRLMWQLIRIPPIRRRNGDIPLLARHIIRRHAIDLNRAVPKIRREVFALLERCPFRGNVRELQTFLMNALWRCQGDELQLVHCMDYNTEITEIARSLSDGSPETAMPPQVLFSDELPTMEQVTDLLLDEAMRRTNKNQSRAAQLIGLTPSAVNKRLRRQR
jgi:DNA-binding NtrC family response regulator